MSTHAQAQQYASAKFISVPAVGLSQTRPFAPSQGTPPQEADFDLQARLEHDQRFSYNLISGAATGTTSPDPSANANSANPNSANPNNIAPDLSPQLQPPVERREVTSEKASVQVGAIAPPQQQSPTPDVQAKCEACEREETVQRSTHELVHGVQQTGIIQRQPVARPTLRWGSRGETVEELQRKLNFLGATPPLVVDGIFGPLTRAAVVQFQQTHQDNAGNPLAGDGIVGPLTWGALDSAAPTPTPTPLPSTVPIPGSNDFVITRIGRSTPSKIYFAVNSSTITAQASTAINALKTSAPRSVRLVGFASADESASQAQDRADAVRAALTTPPDPVRVVSAVGNAGATASSSNFVAARSVEILVGSTPPTTIDCQEKDAAGNLVNLPTDTCPSMDPDTWTAFNTALPIAQNAMSRAVSAVDPANSAFNPTLIDRFFGNHTFTTLRTLGTNLSNLQAHVNDLPSKIQCGGQCDRGGCERGPIAYNTGVDSASQMTLCVPTFKQIPLNDRARNLIHESAHGTSPLGGSRGTGTRDVAYRHERMIFHLSPAERLRNSDSYALFALYVRETEITGNPSAVPSGILTPANDSLIGFSSTEQPAVELSLAKLEKRLTWAKSWMGQLYGQILKVRTGALTWNRSWAEELMTQSAVRFPLTAPPAAPSLSDQTRVAGILDRYMQMYGAVKRDLTVTRSSAARTVINWPGGGNHLEIGASFFIASPAEQISLLFETLARSTPDVEPSFIPAYTSLAEWIHNQNP